MKQKLNTIIHYLIDREELSGSTVSEQFFAAEEDRSVAAGKINAAFLIAMAGEPHPLYSKALDHLNSLESHPFWGAAAEFYKEGIARITGEVSASCSADRGLQEAIEDLCLFINSSESSTVNYAEEDSIRRVFFPEGVGLCADRKQKIDLLRKKRTVRITNLNRSPVADPAKEILFTSNILLTVPASETDVDSSGLSTYLKQVLNKVLREEQLYWYDHPVPVGIAPEHNEVLYGLEGLDRAVAFEIQRGTVDKESKVTCVLSVSVTHQGIQPIVKRFLEEELRKEKNISHLNVYVFTEEDTTALVRDILLPAAQRIPDLKEQAMLCEVIGVDGEYGRHYSFLKAIAAFWQVFINPEIRGTFKIDLDQIFPQNELAEQSGCSAFEHFRTPLWGAEGIDSKGNPVALGMIAGALVNQTDIGDSLFSPDVCFPSGPIQKDELIFFSRLPQALSTEAEMMTRYTEKGIDGITRCIQRIHVTGGTNGILVKHLRDYRPFTPTFIGRAEDQAYIMSVLFDGAQGRLRYFHKDGLIMRHDKETFAVEAIKMAAAGKLVGDYIRTLMFSLYAKALPRSIETIKEEMDPFTGCFISKIPITVVYLRFALKVAALIGDRSAEKREAGRDLFMVGTARLHDTMQKLELVPDPLGDQFSREKRGWNLFYDILDSAEAAISKKDPLMVKLQDKARNLVERCRINF